MLNFISHKNIQIMLYCIFIITPNIALSFAVRKNHCLRGHWVDYWLAGKPYDYIACAISFWDNTLQFYWHQYQIPYTYHVIKVNIREYINIYSYIYIYITARHFRWPCAIFRWHWDVQNTNYDIEIKAICSVSVRFWPNNSKQLSSEGVFRASV